MNEHLTFKAKYLRGGARALRAQGREGGARRCGVGHALPRAHTHTHMSHMSLTRVRTPHPPTGEGGMSRSAQLLRYMIASMEQLRMIKVGEGGQAELVTRGSGHRGGWRPQGMTRPSCVETAHELGRCSAESLRTRCTRSHATDLTPRPPARSPGADLPDAVHAAPLHEHPDTHGCVCVYVCVRWLCCWGHANVAAVPFRKHTCTHT
jgi:hypothetical protein